jgi:hypothetical protein
MNLIFKHEPATNLYDLSGGEELTASLLSPETYARVHNLKQMCVAQLTQITFTGDATEVQRSMMLHSAVQGRIELLDQVLLDCDHAYLSVAG